MVVQAVGVNSKHIKERVIQMQVVFWYHHSYNSVRWRSSHKRIQAESINTKHSRLRLIQMQVVSRSDHPCNKVRWLSRQFCSRPKVQSIIETDDCVGGEGEWDRALCSRGVFIEQTFCPWEFVACLWWGEGRLLLACSKIFYNSLNTLNTLFDSSC